MLTHGLVRECLVAVLGDVVSLPRLRSGPIFPLSLVQLDLLLELATGPAIPDPDAAPDAARPEGPGSERTELLGELELRGLLVSEDEPVFVPVSTATPAASTASGPQTGGELSRVPSFLVRATRHGFEWSGGRRSPGVHLTAAELLAVACLVRPMDPATLMATQVELLGERALGEDELHRLLARMLETPIVRRSTPDDPIRLRAERDGTDRRQRIGQALRVRKLSREAERAFRAAEDDRARRSGRRVPVVGVGTSWFVPPLALGLLIEYAKVHRDGLLNASYCFSPRLYWSADDLEEAVSREPGVFLFSNYLWSSASNLALSARVKAWSADSVTVHGGPDTPKYPHDLDRWATDNPHVDVTVHGEGEETLAEALLALAGRVGGGQPDLSVLATVPGLSYRDGGRMVSTGPRDRIADLDRIPSPVLSGLFDPFAPAGSAGVLILESNRGCPYGCTFCDWGSATQSRIRKFDMDRVMGEIDWCGAQGFWNLTLADANAGIMERDVDIAGRIVSNRRDLGFPKFVGLNYAKNTVKHLSTIIEMFTSVGILAEGKVSLQTHDEPTLNVIRRKNISLQKYDDLAAHFRRNGLPVSIELMFGLPGSTYASFMRDVQEGIDRDVRSYLYNTVLLPNSPMNEPSYRERHGISAAPGELVTETATFTADDWAAMCRLAEAAVLFDQFGVLRQVATFVRSETGMRQVEFYELLATLTNDEPAALPWLTSTIETVPGTMLPPVCWEFLLDEIRGLLTARVGVEAGTALDTVLRVQEAMLPSHGRTFPEDLDLPHDFAAWHAQVIDACGTDTRSHWEQIVPRLGTFGPGTFRVEDGHGVCSTQLGVNASALLLHQTGFWEMTAPASRPLTVPDSALTG